MASARGGRRPAARQPELAGPQRIAEVSPAGRELFAVRLEGGPQVLLSAAACRDLGLAAGKGLDGEGLLAALEADRARIAALRLLAARPRTRADLERRLRRRFPPASVERALAFVARYLDDAAFAGQWLAEQLARRPAGTAALAGGLIRQGVQPAAARRAAQEAVTSQGEGELARRAAEEALRRCRGLAADAAARRIWGVLARRGFSAEASRRALRQLLPGTVDDEGA